MYTLRVAGTFALALTLVSEVTPQHKRACMVTLSSAIYVGSTGLMAGNESVLLSSVASVSTIPTAGHP